MSEASAPPPASSSESRGAAWIRSIAGGAAVRPITEQLEGANVARLADAFLAFAEVVTDDERNILRALSMFATALARNAIAWSAISQAARSLHAKLEATSRHVDAARAEAVATAGAASEANDVLGALRTHLARMLEGLGAMLRALEVVRSLVAAGSSDVEEMANATNEARTTLAFIDELSDRTSILALNAAIEAFHAGTRGRSFSIIASEIGKLARLTQQTTHSITEAIALVTDGGRALRAHSKEADAATQPLQERARLLRSNLGDLEVALQVCAQGVAQAARCAAGESDAFSAVAAGFPSAIAAVDAASRAAEDPHRINALAFMTEGFDVVAGRLLGMPLEAVRDTAGRLAEEVDAIVEQAVASGTVRVAVFRDFSYMELVGAEKSRLQRLHDPPPRFGLRRSRARFPALTPALSRRNGLVYRPA